MRNMVSLTKVFQGCLLCGQADVPLPAVMVLIVQAFELS